MTKHLDVDDHLLNLICIEYRWGVIVLTLCSVIDNERRYVKLFGTRENLHQQVQSCIMHTHIIFHNTKKKISSHCCVDDLSQNNLFPFVPSFTMKSHFMNGMSKIFFFFFLHLILLKLKCMDEVDVQKRNLFAHDRLKVRYLKSIPLLLLLSLTYSHSSRSVDGVYAKFICALQNHRLLKIYCITACTLFT